MAHDSRKSLGAELQHLTVSYSHLFLRAADAFLIWDSDGAIQNANGACCLLSGYEKEELLKMDHRRLFPEDYQNLLDTLLVQSQVEEDGNVLFEGERELKTKEGMIIPVTLRFITVREREGASVLGIIHDIRDLKDLEARLALTQARYKGIVENVREIIFLLDDEGNIIFANQAVQEILGFGIEEALQKNVRDLLLRQEQEKINALLEGQVTELDAEGNRPALCLKTASGEEREFQFFISDIPDERNQPGGLLMVMHDVTGQREIREKLKHAERMQSVENILSKITHEVKNPLAAINASAEFLRRHWSIAEETEKQEVIELIAEETQRINRVITEYLKVRRVPSPTLLPYDIADLVDTVIRNQEQLLRERPGIHLERSITSREMPLDADMMKQILWNLINNAIDAVGEAGDISLTGTPQDDGDYYHLEIRDTGIGMDEETVRRAFEPFYTKKESGTGLGLPMVRQHIDAMNGRIELESTPGAGTTFSIYLPMNEEAADE